MYISLILGFCCFVFFIFFLTWQFKVLKKYALNYDAVNIDAKKRIVTVNKRIIRFIDIESFSIEEAEQPDMAEKYLTKSGYYCYMTYLILNLKDGSSIKCKFNYKGSIYKAAKMLSPYIGTDVDIEAYNPYTLGSLLPAIFLIICLAVLFFKLFF